MGSIQLVREVLAMQDMSIVTRTVFLIIILRLVNGGLAG